MINATGTTYYIGAYGEGDRPHLHAIDTAGVQLVNQSYWVIQDLPITTDPTYGKSGVDALTTEDVEEQSKGIKV